MPFAVFETSSASPRVPSQCKLGPSPPHRSPPHVHKSPPRTRTRAHSPPRVRHSIWEIQRAPRDVLQPRSRTLTERPSTSPCPAAPGSPKSRTATTHRHPRPPIATGTREGFRTNEIYSESTYMHTRARPLPVRAPRAPSPCAHPPHPLRRHQLLLFEGDREARAFTLQV